MSAKIESLSTAAALDYLLQQVQPLDTSEIISTLDAAGRVLALDMHSTLDVPRVDNSQMDGYALRLADCLQDGTCLPISQRIPAGLPGVSLASGTAARIFTGAELPAGADTIVMQEQCSADGETVLIQQRPALGDWIRRAGEDVQAGACVLAAGTRLRAQELGLAASVGLATLSVRPRLRVAVLFTGDELTMPGEALVPGAIYNSNRYTLTTLLRDLGCIVSDLGIVPDKLDATRAALRMAAVEHDVILTSGGVSVGEEDHIKPAVEAEGRLNLWQIAMKPGKPLAFGQVGRSVFFGLPGNPVSSFVTYLLFVRPSLLRMLGVTEVAPRRYSLRADFNRPHADRRNEFLRARINPAGGLELFPNQGSAVLTSMTWADGLIDLAPGQAVQQGDMLSFIPFTSLT